VSILNVFKSLFTLARAKMKQSSQGKVSPMLPDVPDFGALGIGNRIPDSGSHRQSGPRLRKLRQIRKNKNKMASRSRRVNQARREGVNL